MPKTPQRNKLLQLETQQKKRQNQIFLLGGLHSKAKNESHKKLEFQPHWIKDHYKLAGP